ncbi:hexose carrier protein [Colletotrichum truncatum]|uniref:Hexose carrier protein n=1 Tax=Colletotrichum truncatum TaxID=5467 RepID=A0ACC3ZLC2_COLTU|nr:hexose carrier protein [Colletotrichum truncatum]KAF6787039.1 hexose carrier protein [Colletotrichum truncatum]
MGQTTTVLSALFIAIGGFLFGYDSGIIGSVISLPTFKERFSTPDANTVGGIVSSFQGGAILGTIINMIGADWAGRRNTIFAGSVVSTLGCAIQAGSINIPMLIVGRFIAGVAVGMLTATIPMYASELSEAKYRGMLAGLLQWMLSWGFFVAQWLGYGCSHSKTEFSWRFPLAFQTVPSLTLMAGIYFLQESPRWLVEKERIEEARAALQRLRRGQDEAAIEAEFNDIHQTIVADRDIAKVSWKSIITKPSWRRRLLLGCGVQAFGQLSGINVINYYGPIIYSLLGIENQESLMITGISGALSIVYCSIGLYLLDRVGRVKPLIGSAIGMGLCLLVNAVQAQYFNEENSNQLRSMVAMNFLFSFFFTPVGIISWVYPAEIFPIQARALGNAITTFTNWTLNLVFAQFSPLALDAVRFRYFYAFFVFNLVATVAYFFFYPETKQRTLEQMDELFGDAIVDHHTTIHEKNKDLVVDDAEVADKI